MDSTDAIGSLVQSTQPNSIVGFSLDSDVGQATVKDLKIECIPSILLFANSKPVDRVEGTDVSELVNKGNGRSGFRLLHCDRLPSNSFVPSQRGHMQELSAGCRHRFGRDE